MGYELTPSDYAFLGLYKGPCGIRIGFRSLRLNGKFLGHCDIDTNCLLVTSNSELIQLHPLDLPGINPVRYLLKDEIVLTIYHVVLGRWVKLVVDSDGWKYVDKT